MEAKTFKSIHIDLEKGIYQINGEEVPKVSHMELLFEKGIWSLVISRDEFYRKPMTNNFKENQ